MTDGPSATPARADGVEARATILVVDDEKLVRDLARAALERKGYRVLLAATGEEAIRTFAEYPKELSLIVLDMHLPGLSGVEVVRALRSIGAAIPVLVTSGWSEMEVKHRFHGLDIAGILPKPFTSGMLGERVRELCS